ncbi:hypothetical protein [Agromyces sp. SYSU T00194]|uniref:hypothetical protein n=1 Tax=Agromyces chitinivorans TaxID=3158560 RepID=UPI003394E2E6
MDRTPRGRDIEPIEGDVDDIALRADQIVSLGMQMRESAGLLQAIADGAEGMDGLSVEKLREVVGDVYTELRLAGERYTPTGLALQTYAGSLETVQTGLATLIDDCEQAWVEYTSRHMEYGTMPLPMPDPETGTVDDTTRENARIARDVAHDAWELLAVDYDARYDTWEAAFDRATDAIGTATEGGISDSWKDDLAGFVDTALTVLTVVGIVLAVLAIIVGGPLIAVLGTIVGILSLIGTLYMKHYGRADWGEVAWAVVGVIPFGKLGAFADGAEVGTRTFLRGFVALDEIGPAMGQVSSGWTAVSTGLSAGGAGLSGLQQGGRNLYATLADDIVASDIFARYMGAGSAAELAEFAADESKVADLIIGHLDVTRTKVTTMRDIAGLFPGDDPADTWREQLAATP